MQLAAAAEAQAQPGRASAVGAWQQMTVAEAGTWCLVAHVPSAAFRALAAAAAAAS